MALPGRQFFAGAGGVTGYDRQHRAGLQTGEPERTDVGLTYGIEIPAKYETKLEEAQAVEPTIRDQIEIEVLSQVLRS